MKAPNNNGTISINIYCKCRPGSTAYITRSANARGADGGIETTYYFSCSPQSVSLITIIDRSIASVDFH